MDTAGHWRGNPKLTTDSPMSHDGIPALRIEDDTPTDYGPANVVNVTQAGRPVRAADIVMDWHRYVVARRDSLDADELAQTHADIAAASSYLRQWPDGPQIEPWD